MIAFVDMIFPYLSIKNCHILVSTLGRAMADCKRISLIFFIRLKTTQHMCYIGLCHMKCQLICWMIVKYTSRCAHTPDDVMCMHQPMYRPMCTPANVHIHRQMCTYTGKCAQMLANLHILWAMCKYTDWCVLQQLVFFIEVKTSWFLLEVSRYSICRDMQTFWYRLAVYFWCNYSTAGFTAVTIITHNTVAFMQFSTLPIPIIVCDMARSGLKVCIIDYGKCYVYSLNIIFLYPSIFIV